MMMLAQSVITWTTQARSRLLLAVPFPESIDRVLLRASPRACSKSLGLYVRWTFPRLSYITYLQIVALCAGEVKTFGASKIFHSAFSLSTLLLSDHGSPL